VAAVDGRDHGLREEAELEQGAGRVGKNVALGEPAEVGEFRKRVAKKLEVLGLHEFLPADGVCHEVRHTAPGYATIVPSSKNNAKRLKSAGWCMNGASPAVSLLNVDLNGFKGHFIHGCGDTGSWPEG